MADVDVTILSPAASFAFVTVNEAKVMLGLPTTPDATLDPQLQFWIDTNSAVISAMCGNRIFARETCRERWNCIYPNRIFLTHWPVCADDIETVETPEGTIIPPASYRVEERSGKVSVAGAPGPIYVTYTGGYNLPKDAPKALKQATVLLVGQSKAEQQKATTAGIRMIAHKSSRVQFHPESQSSSGGSGPTGLNSTMTAVQNLLSHFTRHWV